VLPAGDRRRRQSWIDALVNVNPPLLQLLEVAPAASVEQVQPIIETVEASPAVEAEPVQVPIESKFGRIVYPRPAQGAIVQVIQNSPGVESVELTQKAHEHKFLLCLKDGDKTLWYDGKDFVFEKWSAKTYCKRGVGAAKHQLRSHPEVKRAGNVLQVVENSPRVEVKPIEVQVQEPIVQADPYSPGVDVDYIEAQLQEPLIECSPGACDCPYCGAQHGLFVDRDHMNRFVIRCLHCHNSRLKTYPGAIRTLAQESILPSKSGETFCKLAAEPIAPVTKNSPGIEVSVSDRKRYWADRGFFLIPEIPTAPEQNPAVEFDGCIYCTSPEYKLWRNETYRCYRCEPEPDQNPILTGITFSDRFLTRYAPPQAEIIHFQPDADGQLSLLNFDIESVDEPPDPDDFESLDAFREAIARWDWEHPTSSFDHCSDHLPSSEHSEPPDPEDFDSMFAFWAAYDAWDEASDDDSEPLEISLDSLCEWAPCPADWYEPVALDGSSKVLEMSSVPLGG